MEFGERPRFLEEVVLAAELPKTESSLGTAGRKGFPEHRGAVVFRPAVG